MDDLDGRLIDLFAHEPRIGVLEASRRLGVARGTVQARLDKLVEPRRDHRLGTGAVGRGARLPGDRVPHPGDPPGRRATTRSAATSPAIPEVLEAHTITGAGDMWARVVARSNTDLQRVIDRVLRTRHRPLLDRDRPGHAGALPGAVRCGSQLKIMQVEVACATSLPLLVDELRLGQRRTPAALEHRALAREQAGVDGDRRAGTSRSGRARCTSRPPRAWSAPRTRRRCRAGSQITPPCTRAERVVVELLGPQLDDDPAALRLEAADVEGVHDRRPRRLALDHGLAAEPGRRGSASRSRSAWPGDVQVTVRVAGAAARLGLSHGLSLAPAC